MATCINPSEPKFQEILQRVGNPLLAELEYEKYLNSNDSQVSYFLKSVEILASPKAKEVFKKGEKNNWPLDKILTELQIPKNQKQLITNAYDANLFEAEGQFIEPTINEIITHLLSANSFTVEINTTREDKSQWGENYGNLGYYFDVEDFVIGDDRYRLLYDPNDDSGDYIYTKNNKDISKSEYDVAKEKAKKEYDEANSNIRNTRHYASLTVPGGTNYTENEIATPAITPAIKGHAQFATEKGIGWFRSDDKYPFTGFLEDLLANGTIKKVDC